MGETYSFDKMTKEKFEVNKLTDKGKIVISSTHPDSFFSKNYATVSEVTFEDNYFRAFLIQKIGADINGDGFLTQDELDKITDLDINISTVGSRYIEVIHNFDDLKHLRNLEKLTIDLGKSGNRYIESITFPDTGNLKELSITNTTTKYAKLEVPAVEKFTYSDNTGVEGDGGKENPPIIVNDTTGGLKAVTMKNAYVSSLELNNSSSNAGKISLDLYNCNALQTVEFKGKGYILKGDASFEECGNLNHIGQEKTSGVWQVDGEFDGNQATFDLTNCVKLCSGISEQIINYNFSSGQRLNVVAYGLNEVKSDQDLTVNRIGSNPGDIYIYCENGSYMYTKYTGEGTTGYYAKGTAAEPNVAVFPCGNAIRKRKGEDGWVDRWDIVLRKGSTDSNSDTINNFTNSLSFYSADDNCARRVNYSAAGCSFKIESSSGSGNDIVSINNTNHTLRAENEGRATIKVYLGDDTSIESKCIGYVSVYVRSIASSISLTNNTSELGEGTSENPIYVAKKDGVVSFSATQDYAGDNLLDKPDEVYWIIAKYENGEYNEMINSLASYDGISVVPGSNQWDGRTNTRAFSFKGDNRKYKLIAQSMVNKTDNAANGSLIRQERYIEVVGPAEINVSNNNIVHDSTGNQDFATITVKEFKHLNIVIKNSTQYSKYFEVNKDEAASIEDASVWKLSLKKLNSVADNIALSDFIAANSSITLLINADGAEYEQTFNLSSTWVDTKYKITYKLNGATNNADNPSEFTVRTSDITLKDPSKEGYTFKGWTGSNGDVPQKNVVIPKGSVGDKEYIANFVIADNPEDDPEDDPEKRPKRPSIYTVNPIQVISADNSSQEEQGDNSNVIHVDTDIHKSDKPIGTVMVSTTEYGQLFQDMKIHFLDNKTVTNQLFLANQNLKLLKAKKIRVIESFGVYPRRDLTLTENGSKQKLVYKLPEKLPVNTVIYAQCYSSKDGAYTISGLVTSNGYAVFNDYILRSEVNVTIFTVE